jgi:hypothetical protein
MMLILHVMHGLVWVSHVLLCRLCAVYCSRLIRLLFTGPVELGNAFNCMVSKPSFPTDSFRLTFYSELCESLVHQSNDKL